MDTVFGFGAGDGEDSMAKPEMKSEADAFRAAFHERMHANNMYGLWELASQMTAHPEPKMIPHMWPWSVTEAIIAESARAVPVGDERRALQLFNPGLGGRWATTNNLIAAVQILLPGEVARAHRHTPTAIRFIIEGNGAYTAVDGERVYMAPGDLILTPSWSWHDHGNETQERVVWMDGLDIPLIASLEAMFFQFYSAQQVPATRPANVSKQLHGHAHISPTWVKEKSMASPLLLYSGRNFGRRSALRDHEGSPFDGVLLEYRHPADRWSGVADDDLHGPTAAARRAHQGAPPYRQRRLLCRQRRGRDDHRRAAIQMEQGRYRCLAALGAA
jgi:gentisate 1,2-dioxygenase